MPIILASFDDVPAEAPVSRPVPVEPRRTQQENRQPVQESRQPMVLAMAYVPWQRWRETYPLEEGLTKGTIFPDLYLPFEGKRKRGMSR